MFLIFGSPSDLATQMRHLTDIPVSPGLNRRSKVLSWISESEDMFEDTGISREQTDGCELFCLHVYTQQLYPIKVTGKCIPADLSECC